MSVHDEHTRYGEDRSSTDFGDVAVIYSEYQDGSAVDALNRLHELGWPHVFVVGIRPDPSTVIDALAAGARGYLAVTPPTTPIPRSAYGALFAQSIKAHHTESEPLRLSSREIEILEQASDGKTNKEIGTTLEISSLTVKSHFARIGRKLKTGDRAHMVLLALRSGVIR